MLTADRIVSTTCPYCGVGCQIDLHIKDEMIFRVNGRFDNQVSHGNLCVKGRFGYDYVHAPDRLRQPLQRASRNDDLAAATWDEALDTVATRLRQIRDSYGPDSVAFSPPPNAQTKKTTCCKKLARAVIGTNSVDHCARL
ncbi:MAG: molybdopterin-dependent oxidoreductase [Chloroflexota bacterium]